MEKSLYIVMHRKAMRYLLLETMIKSTCSVSGCPHQSIPIKVQLPL